MRHIKIQDEDGEVALWVRVLCKHEDLSSDPSWICRRLGVIVHVVITLPGETGGWRMVQLGDRQPISRFNKRLHPKEIKTEVSPVQTFKATIPTGPQTHGMVIQMSHIGHVASLPLCQQFAPVSNLSRI